MKYNIAIIGATGNVGRELLNILHERSFPVANIVALSSEKSAGQIIEYGNNLSVKAQNLADFDFSGIDIAFFSAGAAVSAKFVPIAVNAGAVAIDNTSCFRMDADVPLVIPEVNPDAIKEYKKTGIIANPNCSTIQMLVALKPLHDRFYIERVVVSTYQAASGAGKKAMDRLTEDSMAKFNVLPHIDIFLEGGLTKEEWKMEVETQKILDSNIRVHANCARVASLNCHAEYINIETRYPIDIEEVHGIFKNAPGIKVLDREKYATPLDVSGKDEVYISRLRKDFTVANGLSFWCVADNLRKGAALNAVQIAEVLLDEF